RAAFTSLYFARTCLRRSLQKAMRRVKQRRKQERQKQRKRKAPSQKRRKAKARKRRKPRRRSPSKWTSKKSRSASWRCRFLPETTRRLFQARKECSFL